MDANTVITGITAIAGTGIIGTLVNNALNKGKDRRIEQEAAYAARIAEAIAIRDSDRARLGVVETRLDAAMMQIADLRTDKIRLEGIIDALNHQIAADKVLIAKYEENEITFTNQINYLNERIAAQTAELVTAQERLEAIKNADPAEMRRSLLYQEISLEKP